MCKAEYSVERLSEFRKRSFTIEFLNSETATFTIDNGDKGRKGWRRVQRRHSPQSRPTLKKGRLKFTHIQHVYFGQRKLHISTFLPSCTHFESFAL